jgi:hypothetical protein
MIAGDGLHPDLSLSGGVLRALPVAVSPSAGANVLLVDADQLFVADGAVTIDVSTHAAAEMVDAPPAPAIAAVVLVDWWSRN